jgi:hypothetical protein
MDPIKTTDQTAGEWAIVEIMGHKVVAGYVTKDEQFGQPMLRVDVPPTDAYPAFTQHYGVQSIYCITYVSEQVARAAAQANRVNPVSVYVPELAALDRLKAENERLRRALPAPAGDDDIDDEYDPDDDPDGPGF